MYRQIWSVLPLVVVISRCYGWNYSNYLVIIEKNKPQDKTDTLRIAEKKENEAVLDFFYEILKMKLNPGATDLETPFFCVS